MLARLGSFDLSSGRKMPAGDLALEEEARRHDDVIARAAGEELRLDHLVAVEDVVIDLDAGLRLELGDRVLGDVVGPVVDVEDLLFLREDERCWSAAARRARGRAILFMMRLLVIGGVPAYAGIVEKLNRHGGHRCGGLNWIGIRGRVRPSGEADSPGNWWAAI